MRHHNLSFRKCIEMRGKSMADFSEKQKDTVSENEMTGRREI